MLRGQRLNQKLFSHPHQYLGDRCRASSSIFMEAVERGEGGQDSDHVLGFLERASGPKLVVRGKPLHQGAVEVGFVPILSLDAVELPVEGGISRPRGARLPDSAPEVIPRI